MDLTSQMRFACLSTNNQPHLTQHYIYRHVQGALVINGLFEANRILQFRQKLLAEQQTEPRKFVLWVVSEPNITGLSIILKSYQKLPQTLAIMHLRINNC